MRRRRVLAALASFSAVPLITPTFPVFAAAIGSSSIESIQTRWRTLLAKSASIATDAQPLGREASSWRADLPAGSFEVMFEGDTERPFSSHLNNEKRPGIFVCRACDLPLFSSEMKYDSGTGWPSFFTTIPHHLATKIDFKLIWPRTEYHCVKCDGHQGHIFEDGPQPTGERWCNNGAALRFIPE